MRNFRLWLGFGITITISAGLLQFSSQVSRSVLSSGLVRDQGQHHETTLKEFNSQSNATPIPSTQTCPTASYSSRLSPRPLPLPIYGITIEEIENYVDEKNEKIIPVIESLKLSRTPTVRLIFNKSKNADDELKSYQKAAQSIHKESFVMGELVDSQEVKTLSVIEYELRAKQYVEGLGDSVDIWEIGNEVNGEWLRDSPRNPEENCDPKFIDNQSQTVGQKIYAAFKTVKNAGGKTALTLYYNDDGKGRHCWAHPQDEMFAWAQKYVPQDMKNCLDYVFISFYEDDPKGDCKTTPPDCASNGSRAGKEKLDPDWVKDLIKLADMFPNAKVGFGECGTDDKNKKKEQLVRYYRTIRENLQEQLPENYKGRFVGGYFWWYFKDDMIPSTKPLWTDLNNLIKNGRKPTLQ